MTGPMTLVEALVWLLVMGAFFVAAFLGGFAVGRRVGRDEERRRAVEAAWLQDRADEIARAARQERTRLGRTGRAEPVSLSEWAKTRNRNGVW